jgi:group II intron reverse transcriptase/maturase
MIDVTKEIEHLFRLSKREPGKRFNRLWTVMTAPEWLAQAWNDIRSNRGSRTPGIDGETGTDISVERISSLSERLKIGTYQPKPVRRVYIPKANGKQRPLGIPAIEDRVVQQALRMVLEPIFEADFLDCSHGFRRKRSAHTALSRVAIYYPKTSWIVEGDIVGCFDNIPHEKLIGAVSRRIADEKVLNLIREFLKAGYMEDEMFHRTYSGTPQGGIVSPLLCNIFLHQLDEFLVQELKANQPLSREQLNRRKSDDYQRNGRELRKRRVTLKRAPRRERQQLLAEIDQLEKKQKRLPSTAERHPCKLGYVRYADDFVIMVNGTKVDAECVKAHVAEKLDELGLTLSGEKTKLTHWQNPVRFLGFEVRGRLRDKGVGISAIFSIPADKIREVATEIRTVCGWNQLPEADVMCRVGAIFRGWCNYYCYASGPQTVFGRVAFRAWWRYAHFLARKRKLSVAAVIRHEKQANRLRRLTVNGRTVQTFHTQADGRNYVLNIAPPKTRSIWNVVRPAAHWWGDHRPTTPEEWNAWRDEMKRLALWPPPTRGATGTSSKRSRNQTGTPDAPKGARPVWEGLHGNHASKEA